LAQDAFCFCVRGGPPRCGAKMAQPQTALRVWGEVSLPAAAGALVELARDDNAFAHRRTLADFCAERWEVPLACLAAYLAMVWAAAVLRPARAGPWADRAFAAWNLSFSLFSAWGAWQMGGWLREAVMAKGYIFTVCSDPFSFQTSGKSHATLALLLFSFSKIPELGDTAFLILRGKPVRFLQWYHHSTVMLFCWLAVATEYTPGIWFAMTNYCVHAVMYFYFFLTHFSSLRRALKVVAPLVTLIQIAQMVYGLLINGFAVSTYLLGGYCHIQDIAVGAAVVMYASYFLLFTHLFIQGRRARADARRGAAQAPATPASPVCAGADNSAARERRAPGSCPSWRGSLRRRLLVSSLL